MQTIEHAIEVGQVVSYYPDERDASKHFIAHVRGTTKRGNVQLTVHTSDGDYKCAVPPPSRRTLSRRTATIARAAV